MNRLFSLATIGLLAGATMLPSLFADVVVEDAFEEVGDFENSLMVESKMLWESAMSRQALGVGGDPEGLNSGNSLSIGNNLVFSRIPETALAVGSTLTVTLRFRATDANPEYMGPFRVGLAQSRDDTPEKGDTIGYWLMLGPKGGGLSLEENADSLIGGGQDATPVGDPIKTDIAWDKPHKLVLTFSRPTEGRVDIRAQLDGGEEFIRSDVQAKVTTFNLLGMRVADRPGTKTFVDDVKVELAKGTN
jgi:hypothetical protein